MRRVIVCLAAVAVLTPTARARLQDAGAQIDTASFRSIRPLTDNQPGLVALVADAAILAGSRAASRFADLRIVDDAGRQIPYLVERRDDALVVNVELRPAQPSARELKADGKRSVYALRLPYDTLPSMRVGLDTSARVFQRVVRVGVEHKPDRQHRETWFHTLGMMTWRHADEQSPAPSLVVDVSPPASANFLVVVDDGDNPPLPLTRARVLLPSYRFRFYHPGRALRVVYGNDTLQMPQYDLALLGAQVMSAEAREVTAAADVRGLERETTARMPASYFWIGLAAAVLVLLAIIARLVRRAS